MIVVRAAFGVLIVLTLTGCAGEQFSLGSSAPASAPIDATMTGRWILTAPNSPSCGLEFAAASSARAGTVTPDGGCPGSFYTSRRWALEGDALTITNDQNQPLAQFKSAGTHFEGQSGAGTPLTLSR
jgi:Protease inhibitor Inh